jgi:hypothetical protein
MSGARSRLAWTGTALVLALVVALPLTLALLPPSALGGESGAGAGTGDLAAAALSHLDQDLQVQRLLPPHERVDHLVCPVLPLGPPDGVSAHAGAAESHPADGPARAGGALGRTGAGHALRR